MDTALKIFLGVALFMFVFEQFTNFTYLLGFIFGAFQSLFGLFQYIGASCEFISKFNVIFLSCGLLFLYFALQKKTIGYLFKSS